MTTRKKIADAALSPAGGAVGTGLLALIPARKFPVWFRHATTWTHTAAVAGIIAVPGVASQMIKKISGQEPTETVELSASSRAALAVGAGALVYGSWRFTWWFDPACESALRKAGVPYPRVVMAAVAGLVYYATEERRR